jgi:polyisoprenoid-binding protein YceI
MRNIKLVLATTLFLSASLFAQKVEIDVNKSSVKWTGEKITGSHNGLIQIKSGYLEFKESNIVAGEVIIDMNSIVNLDIKNEKYNAKLVNHLKSDDFFSVENFPTAKFILLDATPFKDGKSKISGTITIKETTENISFEVAESQKTYLTQLKINRSKFDVRYGSNSFFDNLGDRAINDIFVLDIQLSLQ